MHSSPLFGDIGLRAQGLGYDGSIFFSIFKILFNLIGKDQSSLMSVDPSLFPGYHEFFCDRNPNLGKGMNLILGPIKENELPPDGQREEARRFKQSVQQDVK